MEKSVRKINRDALDCLIKYEWPGNVRELKNVIQRSVLLSKKNTIGIEHLPERIITDDPKRKELNLELGLPLKEIEKRYIERTLWWTHGNKIKAAQLLGITRKTLYNKIEEYNL
jgi:DNA-binding NtrC family response regulator